MEPETDADAWSEAEKKRFVFSEYDDMDVMAIGLTSPTWKNWLFKPSGLLRVREKPSSTL